MYSINDDYEDISMDNSFISIPSSSSIKDKKRKNGQNSCAICGAKPTGINFDVLTCSSCKAFFRRNGVKPLDRFSCRLNGNCVVDERSRRQCTACRLQKCFAMGMIKERIRTEEQNQRHRELVEENRRQKLKKYQQHEQNKQLNDEHSLQRICSSSSDAFLNNHLIQIDSIYHLFLDCTQETISKNYILKFDSNLTNVLNSYCTPISSLITFLKQLSQFQQLPIDDRLILLKNNVKILLPILTHLLNATSAVQILFNHPGLHNINNKIAYAYSLFVYIIPDDNKLLILLIIVFVFCPCLFTTDSLYDAGYITNTSRQLIQYAYDEYTQLLWFYILEISRHNHHQAVLTYMKIVTTFLQLQNISSEIYDIIESSVQIDQLHMMMQSILHLT